MSKNYFLIFFEILGIFLLIIGTFLFTLFPKIFENQIKKNLSLRNGSEAYERWRQTSVPIFMKFHFFEHNTTATDDSGNDIQDDYKVRERGPYVYEERRAKHVLAFGEDQNLVQYREEKSFVFRSDLSNGHESDLINMVNLPILGVALNRALPSAKTGFELLKDYLDEKDLDLFVPTRVSELLFDGIPQRLYQLLDSFVDPKQAGFTLGNRFSIFQSRNYLEDEWVIGSGLGRTPLGEITRFATIKELKNSDQTRSAIWSSDACNQLKGTDGSLFEPPVSAEQVLNVFEPQICRSLEFKYQRETRVRGIRTLRFFAARENFQNPFENKENRCYCLSKNITHCTRGGLLDASRCLRVSKGAPVMFSAPHFMAGPHSLKTDVGLEPDADDLDRFGTFLDIEPKTGLVLRAMKRLQLNVEVSRQPLIELQLILPIIYSSSDLSTLEEGERIVIPLLWLEESAQLDYKTADEFKRSVVHYLPSLIRWISLTMITLGAFLVILSLVLLSYHN